VGHVVERASIEKCVEISQELVSHVLPLDLPPLRREDEDRQPPLVLDLKTSLLDDPVDPPKDFVDRKVPIETVGRTAIQTALEKTGLAREPFSNFESCVRPPRAIIVSAPRRMAETSAEPRSRTPRESSR